MLQVKAHQLKSGRLETSHYKVTISRFRARLSTCMNYNSLKGELTIEGSPDVSLRSIEIEHDVHLFFFFLSYQTRIAMNSVGAIKTVDHDERQLQDTIR